MLDAWPGFERAASPSENLEQIRQKRSGKLSWNQFQTIKTGDNFHHFYGDITLPKRLLIKFARAPSSR